MAPTAIHVKLKSLGSIENPIFTAHAIRRFQERSGRRRFAVRELVNSWCEGKPLSREEAERFLGEPVFNHKMGDLLRSDALQGGIWIATISGPDVFIKTYLAKVVSNQ